MAILGVATSTLALSALPMQTRFDALTARVAELEYQQSGFVRTSPGLKLTFGGYLKTDFT